MESRQAVKEERAEAAAKIAADELSDVNKEESNQNQTEIEQQKPGVIGSIIKSVQGTLGHAKDAVTGKAHETAEVTSDTADTAAENARLSEKSQQVKDKAGEYASDKANQAKDTTIGKMGEYKNHKAKEAKQSATRKATEYEDYAEDKAKNVTMQKTGEYKDYTAEKAKEGKDTTVGKLTELKDSAADAARRAMDMLTGKREEAQQKAAETAKQKADDIAGAAKQKANETAGAAKDKYHKTEDATRRKMDEMKIHESHDDDPDRKVATGGIFGALGSILAPKHTTDETTTGGGSKIEVDVDDTQAGKTATTLKQADQMTGQTFNDVGRMDVEGSNAEVEAKDSTGKSVKVKY